MKELENLKWEPFWTSHIGCLKGCLNYLGHDISTAWLFGATGHAFIMNMHKIVCPSGPTAWNSGIIFELCKNIGVEVNGVEGWKGNDGFTQLQKQAWDSVRKTIEEGIPCYGWEFDIPEFYVIYGYDDQGYYYSGPGADDGKGPFSWDKIGMSDIGCLAMYQVQVSKKADDLKTVRDALQFALEFNAESSKWILPDYKSGLQGYDNWIKALEEEKAHDLGMAYNSVVWAECRINAVKFLQEARDRLCDRLSDLLTKAADKYAIVAEQLNQVVTLFPFPPKDELKNSDKRDRAVGYLQEARNAEKEALETIGELVKKMG